MSMKTYVRGGAIGLASLIGLNSMYMVHETEQAVITKFGEPQRIVIGSLRAGETDEERVAELSKKYAGRVDVEGGAGLHFKIPLFESVSTFDDRVLEYDSEPTEIVTKDKKRLKIDSYARWRIDDPLAFMMAVRTENGAQSRLDDIVYSEVREETGRNNLIEIVRTSNDPIMTVGGTPYHTESIKKGREQIMRDITYAADVKADEYGIQIFDVRIKRADLPEQNENSVVQRMIAERARIAKGYRSEGEEEAIRIRADTDKQATVIRTEAYRDAEKIKGAGDAEAFRIYAESFSSNPDFYKLWKTLDTYQTTFTAEGAPKKFVLSTDTEFNRYMLRP
ncbi:protease modulator HflC [Candidatus Woesearchaeota archaeon]|nr:protease modulator HflC [Candidatus Woesearchaeota archaeon]